MSLVLVISTVMAFVVLALLYVYYFGGLSVVAAQVVAELR
jgi:hypothetical protein